MKNANFLIGLAAIAVAGVASAAEGPVPRGIPHLDHVFIIMMENHGYAQVIGNPNMPFVNQYARQANLATNYFAVAHPSLTNYLEVSGGSNFGVLNDNSPDWHDAHCRSNLLTAMTSNESVSAPICPIAGTGTDAATPAIDYANETKGTPGVPSTGDWNLDGVKSIPAANNIVGKTIADQLVSPARAGRATKRICRLPVPTVSTWPTAYGRICRTSTR
jgi:phosphatidylinositol-3-phosphatase